MSYKPAFTFAGQDEPSTNGQAFATYVEAEQSAVSRLMRWTMPTGYLVIESDEAVNWVYDKDGERMIEGE